MKFPRFINEMIAEKFSASREFERVLLELDQVSLPVFVIAFNNGAYVHHMVMQLIRFGIRPVVVNNASTDIETINTFNFLESEGKILLLNMPINFGHNVLFLDPIYKKLPQFFTCTDPDLLFNPKMPMDFLDQLKSLTVDYRCFKAGLALEIRHPIKPLKLRKKKKWPIVFDRTYSVEEWEKQFWRRPLVARNGLEVYDASVDTTFCVVNKANFDGNVFDGVRVAGDFACLHMPWFPDIDILTEAELAKYASTKLGTTSSWIR